MNIMIGFFTPLFFFWIWITPSFALDRESSASLTHTQIEQRTDFKAARAALKQDQYSRFKTLSSKLTDYLLYPYLQYWNLRRHLSTATPEKISAFLTQQEGTLLTSRLRSAWLLELSRQGRWKTYLTFYRESDSTRLQCLYHRALYKSGDKAVAFQTLEKLWLVGRSQPQECDPLFAAWREAGFITQTMVWQRIELAMQARQAYLARYLERFLSSSEQRRWSELWRKVHRYPETILDNSKIAKDSPITRTIFSHGIKRMARKNPTKAAESWNRRMMEYTFTEDEITTTERYIALALARSRAPEALTWLTSLDGSDAAIREWRILTTLSSSEWRESLFWLNQLTADEQSGSRWRYWRARALEETGETELAQTLYAELALERSYYGFLAAERNATTYNFVHRPLTFTPEMLRPVAQLPGIIRAHELYRVGMVFEARREWYAATHRLDERSLQKAAKLAHDWGWHDRAIITLGQSQYRDDLTLRFPLLYQEQINRHSLEQRIDPSWAYAIMRQESAFTQDAHSPKGAIGLMQIMPHTGRFIAKGLNLSLSHPNQLLDANTNIQFGINYLRTVLDRFNQNTVLATAAYNAGSQRIKSWLPKEKRLDADQWIELIPFTETRNYLKQVLAYSTIYDQRRGETPLSLLARMPMIPATKIEEH